MPGRPLHFLICSSGLLRQARMPPRMVSLAGHPVIHMLSGGTRNATNGDRISWFANNIGVQRSWANNNNSQQSSHHPLSLKHRRRFQSQPFPFYPLSGNKNITHRWFSSLSSEEASGKDETDKKPRKEPKSKPVQSKRPPQKFPWYHSEDVLPRIDLEMKLNERIQRTFKQKAFSFLWNASTAYLMGQSRWDSLLGQKAWKDSIAENGAWAFGTGMAALWSHVFRVPMDGMLSEDEDGDLMLRFEFDTTKPPPAKKPIAATPTTKEKNEKTDMDSEIASDDHSDTAATESVDNGETDENAGIATADQVNNLFGYHFIQVYKDYYTKMTNDSGKTDFKVTVEMTPFRTEMIKIGTLPFFSRTVLEEKPTFRKEYFDMHSIARTHGFQAFLEHWTDFANKMTDERGLFMESTVTADILVDCVETFSVHYYPSGDDDDDDDDDSVATAPFMVQGDSVERTVQHLVRMELNLGAEFDDDFDTQDHSSDDLRWYTTNWRIVDVDDLMDPKGEWLIPMPPSLSDKK